jgi:hypothetical protein
VPCNRKPEARIEGKPEVFNFLGFTHLCGKTRKTGRFIVKRKTIRKRLSTKLNELKEDFREVVEVGRTRLLQLSCSTRQHG